LTLGPATARGAARDLVGEPFEICGSGHRSAPQFGVLHTVQRRCTTSGFAGEAL
jgi:hypothetical protein